MLTAMLLIVLGVTCRLVPHPIQMVPLGAIALYAGARLPKRWAFAVPIVMMALADVILDHGRLAPFLSIGRWVNYGSLLMIVAMGRIHGGQVGPVTRVGMTLAGSSLFFLISNFMVWVTQGGFSYPLTFQGLMATYAAGIPFFRNQAMADLVAMSALFFGVDTIVAWRAASLKQHAARSEV